MNYCAAAALSDYVLQVYLDRLEELNPGLADRLIASASKRIDEALSARYDLPLDPVPETVRRWCAVFAAYESLSAITSLVNSEAGSDNEFLALQNAYKDCRAELKDVEAGKKPLPGWALDEGSGDAGGLEVKAPDRMFGAETWRRF